MPQPAAGALCSAARRRHNRFPLPGEAGFVVAHSPLVADSHSRIYRGREILGPRNTSARLPLISRQGRLLLRRQLLGRQRLAPAPPAHNHGNELLSERCDPSCWCDGTGLASSAGVRRCTRSWPKAMVDRYFLVTASEW